MSFWEVTKEEPFTNIESAQNMLQIYVSEPYTLTV